MQFLLLEKTSVLATVRRMGERHEQGKKKNKEEEQSQHEKRMQTSDAALRNAREPFWNRTHQRKKRQQNTGEQAQRLCG